MAPGQKERRELPEEIRAKYKWDDAHQCWIGVVYNDSDEVLAEGHEDSEPAIETWLRRAIDLRPWEPGGHPCPDMRGRRH